MIINYSFVCVQKVFNTGICKLLVLLDDFLLLHDNNEAFYSFVSSKLVSDGHSAACCLPHDNGSTGGHPPVASLESSSLLSAANSSHSVVSESSNCDAEVSSSQPSQTDSDIDIIASDGVVLDADEQLEPTDIDANKQLVPPVE
jgi:hypothetical protein